jgi:penicillin amidase
MAPRHRSLAFLAAILLAALCYAGARPVGPLPALGPLLDPASGAWGLARQAALPARSSAVIPGLSAPVEVRVDDRGVPHVFAANEEDAWRAQGYLVARDRLFQMELQRRATAGTLAELVGPRALPADRAARRRGLALAADRNFTAADSGSLTIRAARAYAEGVNAWIDAMPRAALPLEFRLLGQKPSRWEPRHTFYLFAQMALTLAWEDETLSRLRVRAVVGRTAADALFPLNSPIQEPIQPNGQPAPRYDFAPLPPPGLPDPVAEIAAREREAFDLALGLTPGEPGLGDAIGSNNWAVSPRRTAARHALLAGDPHLELSIPSIWYEIHLQVTGGPEVAGVTFAGSPGVIIGFNRNLAWSFTNTGADVRDYYVEEVDDSLNPSRYRVDGAWRAVERRVETYHGPGGELLHTDTMYSTHRGPLLREGTRWLSMRWTPFEATHAGDEFLRLDRAGSASEWMESWEEFVAPAQNGLVADRGGSIAIRSTARYPVRPGGRGDELQDGTRSAADWQGYLPLDAYPFSRDPAQGFLASANQQPVDPRVNGRYFGSNWYSPWRAMRINQLLRGDSSVTSSTMGRWQTDPGSARADAFVPELLGAARRLAASGRADSATSRAAALLGEWDRRYTRENRRAILFERVMGALASSVWDELIPLEHRSDSTPRAVAYPEEMVLLGLLRDSSAAWWDDTRTAPVERRDEIVGAALRTGLASAIRDFGPPEAAGWLWSRAHSANLFHLLRLPALSALGHPVQGGTSTLGPSPGRGGFGASWRMVVELGDEVTAWATYPGGQSGNPASAHYLDRLPLWLEGELAPVLFPRTPEEIPGDRLRAVLSLKGGR